MTPRGQVIRPLFRDGELGHFAVTQQVPAFMDVKVVQKRIYHRIPSDSKLS